MASQLILVFVLSFCIVSNVVNCSLVTLSENGGYRRIVVAISPTLETVEVEPLLTRLEDLFRKASIALHTATQKLLYFEEVVFALPPSFNATSIKGISLDSERKLFSNPDILIIEDGLFNTSPFTLQHEGCGERGLRIYLPSSFLTLQLNEKALVHEWAHYRYGVFDEHGFENDPLYPLIYQVPGSENYAVTGCTNVKATYTFLNATGFLCNPKYDECHPWLNVKENPSIISSLMDQTFSPKITEFCDDGFLTHNRDVPSMQNNLCREKSVWNVLSRNEDFKNRRDISEPLATRFRYVMESEPRCVFVIEATANLAVNDRMDLIRNAFTYFALYDLPRKSKVSLINLRKLLASYSFVSLESTVDSVLDGFPEAYGKFNVCVECGINQAVKTLTQDDGNSDGFIILVTTVDISKNELKKLSSLLTDSGVKLFVIFFGEPDATPPILEKLAVESTGKLFYIMEEEEERNELVSPLTLLYEAFRFIYESLLWRNRNKVLIDQKIFYGDMEHGTMPFVIDERLESLQVLLTGPSFIVGPPIIKDKLALKVNDTEYLLGQLSFSYKIKIPAYVFTIENPQVGTWKLEFQRKQGFRKPIVVMIRATHSNFRELVNVRSWISPIEGDMVKPWTIYAEIAKGYHPVANAKVEAILHHHASGKEMKLKLVDSGEGNPDIRKNDGIYTHCLTGVSLKGYYTLTLVAQRSSSAVPNIQEKSLKSCCGSYIDEANITASNAFKRIVTMGSFYLDGNILTTNFPPRRIVDMRISDVQTMEEGIKHYTIEWTAPGDEYDYGEADEYEMKVFKTRDDALRSFSVRNVLTITEWETHGPWLKPANAGTRQKIIIQLNNLTSGTYFLAMRAVDTEGNVGDVSNVVELYYTEPFKPTFPITTAETASETDATVLETTESTNGTVKELHGSNLGVIIGVTCGLLFLLIIVGIFLLIYLSNHRKFKKTKKETISPPYFPRKSPGTNEGIYSFQYVNQENMPGTTPVYSSDYTNFTNEAATPQSYYSAPVVSRTVDDNVSVTTENNSSVYSISKRGFDQNSVQNITFNSIPLYEENLPFNPVYTSSLRRQHDSIDYSYSLGTDV